MCGIMAALHWQGQSTTTAVEHGLAALRHRGPDGCHVWQSPQRHVTLGHTALKIMDLVSGQQPIGNEDGQIQCVVNGEFYGFESLRSNLQRQGHAFKTDSDSEILVHLYEDHGPDCLSYLRGEFAFVLWDERTRTLLAARDRFGIKPLFFSQSGETLLFASEVKALHAAGVPAGWDEAGLREKLILHAPLQGRTLFRSISELPAAHFLIARLNSVTRHRYWDFDFPVECDLRQLPEEQFTEKLFASLDEAVHLRMNARVPLACYLSGGLDSASILALMGRYSSNPGDAFCLAFHSPSHDESAHAIQVAADVGANLTLVPATDAILADAFESSVQHAETLFTNAQCVAKFILSRAAHQAGFRAVVTGEGADEIFAGYPPFVLDSFSQNSPPADPHHSPFCRRLGYLPTWYRVQDLFLDVVEPTLARPWHRDEVQNQFLDSLDFPHQLRDRSKLNQSLYLFNQTVLPGHILPALGDRMEMAHSLEARLPFLDHHLVEFSRSIPSNLKICSGAEKYILRKAMRCTVSPAVCGRRKFAMQAPPILSGKGAFNTLLQDTLRGSALHSVPLFEKTAVTKLLDRALASDAAQSAELEKPLLAITTACLLAKTFHPNR